MRMKIKAVKITKPNEIQLFEVNKPTFASDEILLKIKYVGFCGSDLSTYLGKNPFVEYPRIPGHEIAATIVDKGEDVPITFNSGDKVTVVPYTNCGICSSCKAGRFNACQFNQTLGVQRDGVHPGLPGR